MKHYHAFDPGVKVSGRVVKAIEECLAADRLRPLAVRHGLERVEPLHWYPLQLWLDCLSDVADLPEHIVLLIDIGIRAARNMEHHLPKQSLRIQLHHLDKLYQNHHRHGDVGHIDVEVVNQQHYKLICRLPYPDDFFFGMLYHRIQATLKHRSFRIVYDYHLPRRDEGGDLTVYHVTCSCLHQACAVAPLLSPVS